MGKSLIITEKPSVAQEFARVLRVSGRNDGYIENQDYVISWCVGHLVGLVYPEEYDMKYKKWKLEDLPFLPKDYKYDVIKDVRKQYDIVNRLLHREDIDRVYWAGDAGKEGQTIEENIRNFGGVREGMEELRVWIDSQTEEEILRGIREARPMSDYANLGNSGIMRTIEDYAMGINFSRVMSVKYGNLLNNAAGTSSYTAIAVGRVMTCVLGMVVIREREIRNFKETPFYRIIGSFTDANVQGEWKAVEGSRYFESPQLYKENGFKEEKDALALIESLNGKQGTVKHIEKSISRKRAPLLFNLAELQAECSKRFKISPDETLQVAQDLYEKKLTTYPRTDARVLSSAVAKEIYKNIGRLKGYEPTAAYVDEIMDRKLYANIVKTSYTDDSKVTDHYAIIPTGQLTELNSLNSLQRAVFDVIVRRFLSIFYPAAEYENVKLTVDVEGESFFSSAKLLKSKGYLEVATPPKKKSFEEENSRILGGQGASADSAEAGGENGTNGEEEIAVNPKVMLELADKLKNGDKIQVNGYQIKFGKTSPPKRYTSGSMVLAMENAGQLIEDEELREQIKGSGIGTSATRAEIIKKLVRIGYLNLNKKTQILSPENLGEMVFEVVSMTVPALLNPQMTASWEKGLEGITQGTVDFWDYRNKLEDFIRRETVKMIGQDIKDPLAERISDFASRNGRGAGARRKIGVKCPACGGEIVTTPFGYGCANYKRDDPNSCKFVIGEIAGCLIPEEQVIKLISEGRTDLIKGFKSKAGKRFDAMLASSMEDGRYNIRFEFQDTEPEPVEGLMCPVCGGQILKTAFGYRCEHYDRENPFGCGINIGQIAGKKLDHDTIVKLLTEKKTDTIRGFKSKAGKKFDACLVIKKDEQGRETVQFDFENVEDDIVKDVRCPVCGGAIKKTSFGFGCVNYKKDDPESCKFSIGQIAGKSISEANVKQLLGEGHTETIRGFKAKSGSKFDACLKLEDGRIVFDFDQVTDDIVKDVRCPACGGAIKKTSFGFGCVNFKKDDPESCKFSIGQVGGRNLTAANVKQLLNDGRTETIRGFKGKNGKRFDACLKLEEVKAEHNEVDKQQIDMSEVSDADFQTNKEETVLQGEQQINSFEGAASAGMKSTKRYRIVYDFDHVEAKTVKDVKCPKCGGKIQVAPFGFVCENNRRDDPESCNFMVGKIASVKIKEAQLKELLIRKKTDVISGFVAKTGMKFDAPLKLTADGDITFDFPEKPKPVESGIDCPKCGKKLMKTQWKYECECGFDIWHTIAKVELTEEIIDELLKTGKTKKKVPGFTSKAGNVFDSCLKYDAKTNTISFDFDNPGEDAGDSAGAGVLDFTSMDESATADINAEIETLHEADTIREAEAEHENEEATNHEVETGYENDITVTNAENENTDTTDMNTETQ